MHQCDQGGGHGTCRQSTPAVVVVAQREVLQEGRIAPRVRYERIEGVRRDRQVVSLLRPPRGLPVMAMADQQVVEEDGPEDVWLHLHARMQRLVRDHPVARHVW